ncbi:helix-turn-helix domain-containing protein [Mangrovibacterium diazotrophicum]|uniref:Helix-turn-helix protein n=1 Tax=Mangrovibacterium diazotrophicum TaxID=1261403 RepID=A0A419W4U2_9BACT|nr:helix-turn-helix domain-containing protein [Mangrovibacterium diazotrophicum]RKD90469.1 helix-turn-helix protein [Mangrovibacterium diazotrophicum]
MASWVLFLLFSPVYIPLVIAMAIFMNAEKGNSAKKTLAMVLANLAFLFWGLYYFLSGDYEFYSRILMINVVSLLLVYPGIYIYIRQLIDPAVSFRQLIVHLVPAGIVALQSLVYYLMLDASEREQFVTVFRFAPEWGQPVMVFMFFCRIINILLLFAQILFYGFRTISILRQYSSEIQDVFSNTEGIQLNSIKVLNFVLFVGSIAAIGFYSINPVKVFGNYLVLILPLAVISVAIWLFGIVGLRQHPLPELPFVEKVRIEEPVEPGRRLFENLNHYFDEQKPYLNSELKIDDLIIELGTNRTHLSNAINQYAGKNFNRFVNEYRIGFAREYISEHKAELTKDELAELSGFGSVRSFERNFKDCIGESFSQFLEKV